MPETESLNNPHKQEDSYDEQQARSISVGLLKVGMGVLIVGIAALALIAYLHVNERSVKVGSLLTLPSICLFWLLSWYRLTSMCGNGMRWSAVLKERIV